MQTHKRILIAGLGSRLWLNAEEEAIFSTILSDLRSQIPGVHISVLSMNTPQVLRMYGVEEIPVGNLESLIQAARESDLMILGGTVEEAKDFNPKELLAANQKGQGVFVDFALLATLLNKPFMIYAVKVQPPVYEAGRSFLKFVFEQAQLITVTDPESQELLISLGIPGKRVKLTADPVFAAQKISQEVGRGWIQEKMNFPLSSPVLGVSLRPWKASDKSEKDWQGAVARSLDTFIEQEGGTVFIIPFHKKAGPVNDARVALRVRNLMKHSDRALLFDDSLSWEEKVGILSHCDLLLGMHLHPLIAAVRYSIPIVVLGSDPKMTQLFTTLQHTEYLVELSDLKANDLFHTMQRAYKNRSALNASLAQGIEKMTSLARENTRLALQLLDEGSSFSSSLSSPTVETIKSLLLEHSLQTYTTLTTLNAQLAEKEQVIINLRHAVTNATQMLKDVQSSWSWRLVTILQRIRMIVAPPGSFRSRLLVAFFFKLLAWYSRLRYGLQAVGEQQQALIPDFIECYLSSSSSTRVLLIAKIFFDPMGNNMQAGGAERYLLELVDIVRAANYEPIIIQCGNDYWMRYYGNQLVIGIRVGHDYDSFIRELEKLNPQGALAIYSPFELASPKIQIPSIGISHGIYWDEEAYHRSHEETLATIDRLKVKAEAVNTLISVDTNTINWLRTVNLTMSQKTVYIPNFVNLEQFGLSSVKTDFQRLIVLFPRRLVYQRGFWLVHEILPAILEKYPHVDFHFVGKGGPQEQQAMIQLTQKYPQRVYWYFLLPEEMHIAYQKADITLIPTTHSEGTSLSCLEAMAMGNAIIATNVGGLPDLILDGYNGLLIEPTPGALQKALEKLINDSLLRYTLGERGQDVVKTFSIDNWRAKWKDVLVHYLPERSSEVLQHKPRFVIFPNTWGHHWHGVKQRPHHIAVQFSQSSYEVYWYTPEGRQADPSPNIHLLSPTDDLYVNRPVLFVYYPHSYPEIGRFRNPIVIYDVLDDISIYEASGQDRKTAQEGREYHQKLLESADIVVASSRLLIDQVQQKRPDVIYLPNGVDMDHFYPQEHTSATKIKREGKPLIGYHGAVASWFDGRLVAETAQLRPNYQFIIIGPVSDVNVEAQLRSQPNIQLLGPIPYEDIPSYVAQFDVSIMPFVLSKLTHAVRPLKVVEYLSMRKPVVATPIHEILDWPGILFAEDASSFAEKLDMALHNGLQDKDMIEAFVMDSAWNKVIQPLLNLLDEKEVRAFH